MPDRLAPEQRHRCMKSISSRNTKPEMMVRRYLTLKGLDRTLNQIYLENYSLHKVRPYAPVAEETGTMIAADGGE